MSGRPNVAFRMQRHELTPRQREVVRMVLAESNDMLSAARRLRISESAVRSAVNDACDRMRVGHVTDLRKYVERNGGGA